MDIAANRVKNEYRHNYRQGVLVEYGVIQRRWLGWLAALVLLAAFVFIVILIVKSLSPVDPFAPENKSATLVSSGKVSNASNALEQADGDDMVRSVMSMRYGDFPVIREAGSGDRVITIPVAPTVMMVRVTNKDGKPLSVWGADSNGQPLQLITSSDEVYKGTTLYDTRLYNPRTIKVMGSGSWVVKLLPVSEARIMGPITTYGTGDTIVLFDGKLAKFDIKHEGSGDFKVSVIGDGESELLASNALTMAGVDPPINGPAVVVVQTEEKWTITKTSDSR